MSMNKLNNVNQLNKDELLFADVFLKEHFDRIVDWAVGDIKRCCRIKSDGNCDDGGALVGAFMLWCCAIEYFGGLYTGNPNDGGTKARMQDFITKYMPRYDYLKIYDLRWSLLHYYSPHHFALCHENNLEANKNRHLSRSDKGIILHLGWSVKDLEDGVSQYKQDLESNDLLKMKAWKYYKKQYPIMPIKIEEIRPSTLSSLATGTLIQSLSASGTISEITWTKRYP